MNIRAIRGATCLQRDDATEMAEAVTELLLELMSRNAVDTDDLISVLFTSTPDLHSAFPAAAARGVGLADVPLICAQEIDVAGAMEKLFELWFKFKPRSQDLKSNTFTCAALKPCVKTLRNKLNAIWRS